MWVARGKASRKIEIGSEPISDEELTGLITARSGTLRAPTLRRGKTLVVGYSDGLYQELFG